LYRGIREITVSVKKLMIHAYDVIVTEVTFRVSKILKNTINDKFRQSNKCRSSKQLCADTKFVQKRMKFWWSNMPDSLT